jgi:MFS family permease
MVGPLIAGPMAQAVGWRSFWWLNVAILAFNTITLIFLFPETKWHRLHPSELGHASPVASDVSSTDKGYASNSNVDDIKEKPVEPMCTLQHSETTLQDPYLGKGGPSRAQFKLWQPADEHTNWWIELFTPWKLFAFPIVEFASFVVSWSASCFLTVNLTQAQNFAYPPYNYSTTVIALFNFALLIGTFIGLATAGPLSDWLSMKLTIRNNGIREPEMRLVAMIPYVLIMILGNVINAVGYQNSWDCRVPY